MKKSRFIGGLIMVGAAAILLLFAEADYPTPLAIGLGVVGLALVASSRRM